ncbi:hypothetical protein STPYR_11681 [uncultured Stenotrophomonas sp.]|uniref:Uncharacterized protein n=1 Tax=uncultured Stenotrophomonas sp. TaxID=165438 RepID=A0A1Y5Q3C7_9GAMM|nr:hypothetical protein STPYR_11681 [uncultured Stenotrophomonas sp.]
MEMPQDTASRPLLNPVDGYMRVNYRHHYAELLRMVPTPPEAIAELCLFRFWLACRAHHHAHAGNTDTPTQRQPPAGWPLPCHASGLDIERVLGRSLLPLLESRLQLYDRFVLLGHNSADPQGLGAAALALSCQLFVQAPPIARAYLQAETRHLFARMLAACTTAATFPA